MQYMEGLSVEDDECPLGFLWEDQSWGGLSYSDDDDNNNNNSSSKEKAPPPPPPPPAPPTGVVLREEANAPLVSNKRGRGGKSSNAADAVRKGKRVMAAATGELGGKDHELHIWTERERRKKMRNMFAALHQLLPHLPPKADKSSIVDEAVSYIKQLQQTATNMEKLIQEKNRVVSPIGCESSVTNPNWTPYESPRDKALLVIAADRASSNNNLLAGAPNSSSSTSSPASSFAPPPPPPVTLRTWASANVVLNIFGDEAEFSICAAKKPGLLTTIAFVLEKYRIDVISASIFCNRIANRYIFIAHANDALLKFPEANSVDEIFKRAAGEIMMWAS